MSKPNFPVAVVMQPRAGGKPRVHRQWEPPGRPAGGGPGGPRAAPHQPRLPPGPHPLDEPDLAQWLHPGFTLQLHRDEAEGYYLNVSGPAPSVFILWRMDEERGLPLDVTVSSEEAGRWLDGGHSVDRVGMPPEIFAWVGEYGEPNYRPEPEKRIKPRWLKHPKDRV